MAKESLLQELVSYVLPQEFVDYFELIDLQERGGALHLYLEECDEIPEEYKGLELYSNGFYAESTIKDFPLRDRKVVLHIRRRRWLDAAGKSYSRQWELAAQGTRYSKEFAYFLKEAFGYLPDSGAIS